MNYFPHRANKTYPWEEIVLWIKEKISAPRSEAAIGYVQGRPAGFRQNTVSQLFNYHEILIQHKVNITRIIVCNIDTNV